jgi:hypothetical protein
MGHILVVVGDASVPTADDDALRDLIEDLGHTTAYVSDETAEDVTGFDGVIICDSSSSGTLGTKYNTVAIPVITHEQGNTAELRIITLEGTGDSTVTSNAIIQDDTHPIADGPYGSFTGNEVFSSATTWGHIDDTVADLGAGGVYVAHHPAVGFDNRKFIAAYESGGLLADGNAAPAKRAFLTGRLNVATSLTADGIALFKNAYAWAFGVVDTEFDTQPGTLIQAARRG